MTRSMYLWLALTVTPATAAEHTVSDLYGRSYAYEAAYAYDDALEAMAGIPLTGVDAYLVPLRQGWLLYLDGDYEGAVEAYEQALRADEGSLEAHLGLTLPLMALKRWSDAERHCQAVLDQAPGSYLALSRLAYSLYNSGKYPESEEVYAELVSAYPSDADMRAGLAWALLKQDKTDEARRELELVLHLVPDHASAQAGLDLLE